MSGFGEYVKEVDMTKLISEKFNRIDAEKKIIEEHHEEVVVFLKERYPEEFI